MAGKKKKTTGFSKFITPSLLLAAFIALATQGYYSPRAQNTNSFTITRVIDGDTVETNTGAKIRLASVDAPEYPKGCLSLQAKNRLEILIKGKSVTVEKIQTDNFGRDIAYVYEKKLLINQAMVSEGLAQVDKKTKETTQTLSIEQAEREAKLAKRGIWSEACENTQKAGCVIKGNYRKDNETKIYHLPNCYNYEKTVIDTQNKDRWFCSEKEAIAAGFTKSADCPTD